MTTDNSLNEFPPLRDEVERTLRLRAWKDETFRQELIADPKNVIQRLFPEYFPDGKAPEQVTYKVIEEDQYTHHIILPALPDEFLAPELPKSEFISQLPPLREEVERTLRLRAWEDEMFRQELILDPKHVIERLFPHCFPDGKAPERITYKVIEEDQYTHHIVLPVLPDEFLDPEVLEEVQLALIANMGCCDVTYSNNCSNGCGPSVGRGCRETELNNLDSSKPRKRSLDLLRKQDGKHESEQSASPEPSRKKSRDLIRDRAQPKA